MPDRLILEFDGLSRQIALAGCSEIYASFATVFRGWRIREVGAADQPPILSLGNTHKGYRLEGAWLANPIVRRDRVDALCGFIAEFIRAYVNDDKRLLCLHGAAAEFAGRRSDGVERGRALVIQRTFSGRRRRRARRDPGAGARPGRGRGPHH